MIKGSGYIRTFALIGLAVLAFEGGAGESNDSSVEASESPVLQVLDEVLVIGRQPGPALWQVKSGSHVLWIMGEVTPLPRKLTWRSKQLERIFKDVEEVLLESGVPGVSSPETERITVQTRVEAAQPADRILPNGQTLRDLLAPEQYTRFEVAATRFATRTKGVDRFAPGSATSLLFNNALQQLGFAQTFYPVSREVLAMARRGKVKVTGVLTAHHDNAGAAQRADPLNTCGLEALLLHLQDGGAAWKAQSNAWAVGDIQRLKQIVPVSGQLRGRTRISCASAGDEYGHELHEANALRINAWLAAAERALETNTRTLAVSDMIDLLASDGFIAQLRARGYEVVEPGDRDRSL